MKIHHITLLTGNIPQTINFYEGVLGLRFVKNSVNQENPTRRHIYFADYIGSPGTAVTFIEVPRLGPRYDEDSYIAGLDLYAPVESNQFWRAHLQKNNVSFELLNDTIIFQDPNGVQIRFFFINEKLASENSIKDSTVPADFQLLRIKNTTVYVKDLNDEEEFFKKLTGIAANNHILPLDDRQSITFKPISHPGTKRFGRGSIDHFALSAVDKNQIAAIRDIGLTANFYFEKEIDRKYFYSVYFRDPNDNRIEFATLGPGFTVDEDLANLGKKLGLPDHLEPLRAELVDFYATEGVVFNH